METVVSTRETDCARERKDDVQPIPLIFREMVAKNLGVVVEEVNVNTE